MNIHKVETNVLTWLNKTSGIQRKKV